MAPNPEYVGHRLYILVGVFTPLQIAAVAMREYSRRLKGRPWSADDWLVVASLFGQIVMGASIVAGVKLAGIGYHQEYALATNPGAFTIFFQFLLFWSAWYLATFSLFKLAICLLYKRLFPQNRPATIITSLTAAILILGAIAGVIADIVACQPFHTHWGALPEQKAHCNDKDTLFIWNNFPNIVTEVVMLVLPLPIVWKLQMTMQLKAALTGTFLVGSMGLVSSILRFRSFVDSNVFKDITFTAIDRLVWTLVEPGIYLISACLLMSRPLLDKFGRKFGSIGSSMSGSRRQASAYPGGAYGPSTACSRSRQLGHTVEEDDGDSHGSTIALGANLKAATATQAGFQVAQ